MNPTPLDVRVIVRHISDGEVDHDRIINQYSSQDRQWLAKTAWWAAHNNRSIVTIPLPAADGDISPRRFADWPTGDLAAQCRAQAREALDPELESFMVAVAERLGARTWTDETPATGEIGSFVVSDVAGKIVMSGERDSVGELRVTYPRTEQRLYAYCCALGGGNPAHCDCVDKDHAMAAFTIKEPTA